jgi:hypothetical protein
VYILTLKSKILVIYIILVIEPTSITYNNENDGTLVFSISKTDCHDITEILLKVSFNTITLTPNPLRLQQDNFKSVSVIKEHVYQNNINTILYQLPYDHKHDSPYVVILICSHC